MAHWFRASGNKVFDELGPEEKYDLTSFDGNAQGFRILTQTANHVFKGGLRLTYAVLGAFLKYPRSNRKEKTNKKRKFSVFLSEEPILDEVGKTLGLRKKYEHQWARHPLAFLVEAADDICYAIIDLEDAVELSIMPYAKVEKLLLSPFTVRERKHIRDGLELGDSHRVNLARLRGPVFEQLVGAAIEGFMRGYDCIMRGDCDDGTDVFSFLSKGDMRRKLVVTAKRRAQIEVFPDPKKVELELGSYAMFDCLLKSFCEAAVDRAKLIPTARTKSIIRSKTDLVMRLLGDHAPYKENGPPNSPWTEYQCLRRAGFRKFLNRWAFFHIGVGILLAWAVKTDLSNGASSVLLPLAGILVGLSFAWAGNAQALLQSTEIEVLSEHHPGGYVEYVFTYQAAILVILTTLTLWGLAGLHFFDETWPTNAHHYQYFAVKSFLFSMSSLTLRECWHIVLAAQWMLIIRKKIKSHDEKDESSEANHANANRRK